MVNVPWSAVDELKKNTTPPYKPSLGAAFAMKVPLAALDVSSNCILPEDDYC
jgi:hypothetical protein